MATQRKDYKMKPRGQIKEVWLIGMGLGRREKSRERGDAMGSANE